MSLKKQTPPQISDKPDKPGRGGSRFGAGRKKGGSNRKTRDQMERALKGGTSPLDYMLAVMRDPKASLERRDEMARASARYCHASIQAIQHSGDPGNPVQLNIINKPVNPKRKGA